MNYCKVFCLFVSGQKKKHFTRRFVMQFSSSLARALYTIIDYIKNRIISQNFFEKDFSLAHFYFFIHIHFLE